MISLFKRQKESHQVLILAPTGSASALLAGYTYHSAPGIHDNTDFGSIKNVAEVHEKLDGVDYVVIDEVSMLSCHGMYKTCAQMAKAFNIHDIPFGGKNIMILHNCLLVGKNLHLYTVVILEHMHIQA